MPERLVSGVSAKIALYKYSSFPFLSVTYAKEVMFSPLFIHLSVNRIKRKVFKQLSWNPVELWTTVTGSTYWILGSILLKMANWQLFWISVILYYIIHDCQPWKKYVLYWKLSSLCLFTINPQLIFYEKVMVNLYIIVLLFQVQQNVVWYLTW